MVSLAVLMAMMRGLHLAATLSLLGTVGFIAWILPAAAAVPERLHLRLARVWLISGLIALVAGSAWLTLQAASIADAGTLSDLLDALPVVALHTRYGHVVMMRLGLLLLATIPAITRRSRRGPVTVYLAIAITTASLGLQGLIGHAGAMAGATGDSLILSETLHLVAAGLWLGALLPLWASLRMLAPIEAGAACERFSPIGLACILVLTGTGLAQGLELIGSLPALFGTPYGHIALLKIALFLLALVMAACNRLWLTDRLTAGHAETARYLQLSGGLETCAGMAIVTAAAFMASLPPAAHTTPIWPFTWQFSLVTVNEDAELRRDVIVSLVAIGGAAFLMAATLFWRRYRLLALIILATAVVLRGPTLSLLTVEAFPTSFQTSPTNFSAVSIVHGQALFTQHCVACHGAEGEGNGPAAANLAIKPPDLTAPHLWEHTDGELFWWLTHGVDDTQGGVAMPGFVNVLPANDRWALIDYIRAHNAGFAVQQDLGFDIPLQAPAFAVTCAGVGGSSPSEATPGGATTADLRGHMLHVVASEAVTIEVPPQAGIATINLALRDTVPPAPGSCVAADEAAWGAYAVLAGVPPDGLNGAEFLVDPNGWLSAARRPGLAGAWRTGRGSTGASRTRESLTEAVREIFANPIEQSIGVQHEHHH